MDEDRTGIKEAEERGAVDQGRRRLGKAGVAAIPALLMLRHGSVRAAEGSNVCRSPSALGSFQAGTSLTHNEHSCAGRSPGYWKNEKKSAPIDRGTRWADWFTVGPDLSDKSDPAKVTLWDILDAGGDVDPHEIHAHFVAALLNVKSGWVPRDVIDVPGLDNMYTQWFDTGAFEYYPRMYWRAEGIKDFLATTWAWSA